MKIISSSNKSNNMTPTINIYANNSQLVVHWVHWYYIADVMGLYPVNSGSSIAVKFASSLFSPIINCRITLEPFYFHLNVFNWCVECSPVHVMFIAVSRVILSIKVWMMTVLEPPTTAKSVTSERSVKTLNAQKYPVQLQTIHDNITVLALTKCYNASYFFSWFYVL